MYLYLKKLKNYTLEKINTAYDEIILKSILGLKTNLRIAASFFKYNSSTYPSLGLFFNPESNNLVKTKQQKSRNETNSKFDCIHGSKLNGIRKPAEPYVPALAKHHSSRCAGRSRGWGRSLCFKLSNSNLACTGSRKETSALPENSRVINEFSWWILIGF